MKKIFKVLWYNSDGYGIMGHTTVVIQAETPEEATEKAKIHLTQFLNSVEEHLKGYEGFEVEDISDKEILSTNISAM